MKQMSELLQIQCARISNRCWPTHAGFLCVCTQDVVFLPIMSTGRRVFLLCPVGVQLFPPNDLHVVHILSKKDVTDFSLLIERAVRGRCRLKLISVWVACALQQSRNYSLRAEGDAWPEDIRSIWKGNDAKISFLVLSERPQKGLLMRASKTTWQFEGKTRCRGSGMSGWHDVPSLHISTVNNKKNAFAMLSPGDLTKLLTPKKILAKHNSVLCVDIFAVVDSVSRTPHNNSFHVCMQEAT